jgi:hypothetical protein
MMVNPHILHHQTLGLNSERYSLRSSLLAFQLTAGFGMVAEVSNRILPIYSRYTTHVFKRIIRFKAGLHAAIGRNSSPGIDKY